MQKKVCLDCWRTRLVPYMRTHDGPQYTGTVPNISEEALSSDVDRRCRRAARSRRVVVQERDTPSTPSSPPCNPVLLPGLSNAFLEASSDAPDGRSLPLCPPPSPEGAGLDQCRAASELSSFRLMLMEKMFTSVDNGGVCVALGL